jgi:hypothetical protein
MGGCALDNTNRNTIPLRGSPRDQSAGDPQSALGGDSFGGFSEAFTVVCAWCRKVIVPGGPTKSHGICPDCKRKMQNEGFIDP